MSDIIVALDFDSETEALQFVATLRPSLCRLKIGKAMFTRLGPDFVKKIIALGYDVFLDLKFHDIPQQVYGACKAAADLGVWMLNVHASGGLAMMQAAIEGVLASKNQKKPILLAVTVLTSLSQDDLLSIGCNDIPEQQVLRLAELAKEAGLDGVVCSAEEASSLRTHCGDDFCLVTPGIRLTREPQDDQKRVQTPDQARSNGVNYLVIGRPITKAAKPLEVLEQLQRSD